MCLRTWVVTLLVYVDDIMFASNCDKDVRRLKKSLDDRFKLKDLSNL